jgi:hypothetical protein
MKFGFWLTKCQKYHSHNKQIPYYSSTTLQKQSKTRSLENYYLVLTHNYSPNSSLHKWLSLCLICHTCYVRITMTSCNFLKAKLYSFCEITVNYWDSDLYTMIPNMTLFFPSINFFHFLLFAFYGRNCAQGNTLHYTTADSFFIQHKRFHWIWLTLLS